MDSTLIYGNRRGIMAWLAACALLVALMVALGGYTRLSGSGLSITQWKPIHGVLPPMSDAAWEEEFAGYRASPQYIKVNNGITLSEFKTIFWPEFLHRLLGRAVGIVFFVPLLYFVYARSLRARFGFRMAGIFALGGLQGLIGWLMVKSGLVDAPSVSHIRLAMHLSVAFLIYALLLWAFMDVAGFSRSTKTSKKTNRWYKFWFAGLCVQVILGAFMAGLHGGLIYNSWPTMNGQWVPSGLLVQEPVYMNFLYNIDTIQFMHRTLAAALVVGFAAWYIPNRRTVPKRAAIAIAHTLALQFVLGVLTLLHHVPLPLALAHQLVALLLFSFSVALLRSLGKGQGLEKTHDDQLRSVFPAEHRTA